jgi:hypothetical protein
MGEPAELGEHDRADVRLWAQRMIEAVRADAFITWNELLGCDANDKDSATYAALVRAQVIEDSVSRSRLADALESEVYETSSTTDAIERAKREGWNLATRSLITRLREGFTP